jgi:hypothetical protein
VKPTRAESDDIERKKALCADIYAAIQAGEAPVNPTDWLDKLASKHGLGPKTAKRIRQEVIAQTVNEGWIAAFSWEKRGRRPGRENTLRVLKRRSSKPKK